METFEIPKMEYSSLFNDKKVPVVGLGLWQVDDAKEFEDLVNKALELGYRYFDTAYTYKNEAILGNVLNKWISSEKIDRNELFISTKLPQIGMEQSRVEHFLKLSLNALQLDYVDLYLVHFPVGFKYISDTDITPKNSDGVVELDYDTNLTSVWKSMENQVSLGRAKSIGVSNFNANQIEKIMEMCTIQPAINQIELNVYFQQILLREACKKHNIKVVGYGNFGSPSRESYFKKFGRVKNGSTFTTPAVLEDPVVRSISEVYNKTPAQILLKHLNQLEIIVIPGAKTFEQLEQNIQLFDFEIGGEHMKSLSLLDKGSLGRSFKMEFFPGAKTHPEFPFHET